MQLVADLGQLEADVRVSGPEAADQVRYEPGAQRVLEGQGDRPGVGFDQLADRGDPVVELVQQRVDVPLEHRARLRHPEGPAGPPQQWRPDLGLQAGQGP